MGIARQLYQLQEVELGIEAGERSRAEIEGQLGDSRALAEARAALASEKRRFEGLVEEQRSAEWDMEDLGNKLAVTRKNLYGGHIKNPKELASLQQEGEGLKVRCERLEEKVLGLMEQAERAEAGVETKDQGLKKLEEEWRLRQQGLSAEMERLRNELAELGRRRGLLLAEIDPAAVELYGEAKRQKGRAVASVEQGVCHGCGLSLSSAWLQRARGGELVRCSSCSRILFLE